MRPGDCRDARIVRPGGVLVLHRTEGGTDRPPATGWAVARGPGLCLELRGQRARGTGRWDHPLCLVGAWNLEGLDANTKTLLLNTDTSIKYYSLVFTAWIRWYLGSLALLDVWVPIVSQCRTSTRN